MDMLLFKTKLFNRIYSKKTEDLINKDNSCCKCPYYRKRQIISKNQQDSTIDINMDACDIDCIRFINAYFVDGEKFLDYCTKSDFEETVNIGDNFTIVTENLYIQGMLYAVDVEKNAFEIVHDNDKHTTIKCSDVIVCSKLE